TFQRYVDFDMGAVPFYYDDGSLAAAGNTVLGMVDLDVQEWNVGVRYWYTSNLSFELSYSNYRLSGDAAWL
ncbi:hypothetical protein, partial [Klebsiella pneumoniae]|uniref:hypothetical protein n=1 Tax=Klebsiella pneumoniae TaxID=573 RepID=UPI0025A2DA63